MKYPLSALTFVSSGNSPTFSTVISSCGCNWWWSVQSWVTSFATIIPESWSTVIWGLYESSYLFFLFSINLDSGSVMLTAFWPLFLISTSALLIFSSIFFFWFSSPVVCASISNLPARFNFLPWDCSISFIFARIFSLVSSSGGSSSPLLSPYNESSSSSILIPLSIISLTLFSSSSLRE